MDGIYESKPANVRSIGYQRIEKTGAYEGEFTRAEHVVYATGSEGIEFDFRAKNGDLARFINVCTCDPKGDDLFGRPMIDGIMTILGCRKMAPSPVDAEIWDKGTSKFVIKTIQGFRELMGYPIGLILQKEFYTTPEGVQKERLVIYNCFNVSTRMTAREIIDGAPFATEVDQTLARLKDKRPGWRLTSAEAVTRVGTERKSGGSADIEDNIPF